MTERFLRCAAAMFWVVALFAGLGFETIGPGSPALAQEVNGLAAAAAIQDAFVSAIEIAEKSVVAISRDKRSALPRQAADRGPFLGRGGIAEATDPSNPNWIPNEFGAGIIIGKDGLILTNYH